MIVSRRRRASWLLGMVSLATLVGMLPISAGAQPPVERQAIIQLNGHDFPYQIEAGSLPIQSENGAGADIFYTSYSISPPSGKRPITFIWNGGPGSPSSWLQFQGFGPRRLEGNTFVDNHTTLLPDTDLVFVDPVGTGFSRAASAEASKDFYSTVGDAKATTQFILEWLRKHRAQGRPLYIIGESFGGYRAGGTVERLETAGQHVTGVILVSGGVASGPLISKHVRTALTVPQRSAGALALGRLSPELSKDRGALMREVTQWSLATYLPALVYRDRLSAGARDAIADDLARYTGYPRDKIDLKSLVISEDFLRIMSPDPQRPLDELDMRQTTIAEPDNRAVVAYYRALGVTTDRAYWDADTKDPRHPSNANWTWNYRWPESAKWGSDYAEPWLPAAIKLNPRLRVLVAAGLYDFLNSCAENDVLKANLEPDLAAHYTMRCYLGGHLIYRDPAARAALANDISQFLRGERDLPSTQ